MKSKMLYTSVLKGLGASVAAMVALCALTAFLIMKGLIPQTAIEIAAPVIICISVLIGSLLALSRKNEGYALHAFGTAAAFYSLCLLLKVIFDGEARNLLVNAIACIVGALLAVLIRAGKNTQRPKRKVNKIYPKKK